jgi:TusA-related sulfurtransferase
LTVAVACGEKDGMAETRLDLRGLKCPLPALKTRKTLTRLAQRDGELLVFRIRKR